MTQQGPGADQPTLQHQARALGDPTRHAIFNRIADSDRPISVIELNEHFTLNHNAIRQHLARLTDAGLVVESKAPSTGRGRPRLVYEVSPAVEGNWGTTGPYEKLSRLLAEMIASGRTAAEVGQRAASRFGVPSPSGDVVADVTAAMARQGFEPEERTVPGGVELVLRRCPFASTASVDPDTVCSLHLGIAEGLTDGTGATVDELVANDPAGADCVLRIRVEMASDDHEAAKGSTAKLSLRGATSRGRAHPRRVNSPP